MGNLYFGKIIGCFHASIVLAILLITPEIVSAQRVKWTILSPLADSIVSNQGLFVSLRIDSEYQFAGVNAVQVFLDNKLLEGMAKVNENKISFLYRGYMADGKHQLRVEAKIKQLKYRRVTIWDFYVNKRDNTEGGKKQRESVKLSGTIALDNRNEFLSGSGAALRQEPSFTRTLTIDAAARYKDATFGIRGFVTSNNNLATQSMNYFSVGFRNKWIDIEGGDLNPVLDRLILTGVRMRGFKLKLKYHSSSVQVYYGTLSKAVEGSLQTYVPGTGVLPSNLVNDSQYIASGTYKRDMMAARFETGDSKDNFKLGITGFKAKDDVNSIKYGLAPKDNIAGGMDLTIKMIHKAVVIQSGIAGSIFTNDIKNGPLDQKQLDSIYNINLGFDPKTFQHIIVLNSSTVPTSLSGSDYFAYYSQLSYANKYQTFTIEYKKNGALFYSLGNPFLNNDYQGFRAGERFFLFNKKLSFDLGYQQYSNDLNQSQPSKVNTVTYNGTMFLNPGTKWPTLMFNYMNQKRDAESFSDAVPAVNDLMNNYLLNLSMGRDFWHIKHYFRLTFNMNERKDKINPQSQFTMYNGLFGITESIGEHYGVNADFGKMLTMGANNATISDNVTYNLSADWRIKPGKYTTSLAFSNNASFATSLTGASNRMSVILRFGYRFYKGMGIDIEGGYQPFQDKSNSLNNYSDSYVYIRYSCDLSRLK